MFRLIIRLIVAAIIANAAWRLGTTYASFYKFKDSVHQMVQFSENKSDEQIRQRVLALGSQFDQPVTEENLTVGRTPQHIVVNSVYKQPVQLFPGFTYQWPFALDVDVLLIDLRKPLPQ